MKKSKQISFNQEEVGSYLKEIRKIPTLTVAEEKTLKDALVHLTKTNNKEEKEKVANKLVESNLRFVLSIAKDYQGNGLEISDIIQEGNYGLKKACLKYDPSMSIRFISYAVHWVRQSIREALNNYSRTIRIPVNIVTDINKSKNNKSEEKREQDEIFYTDLESAYPTCVSLDSDIDDEQHTLLDILPNNSAELPDDSFTDRNSDLKTQLRRLLDLLDKKELFIILNYYGLNGGQCTLEELGEELNLTKERVRQVRDKGLRKLRSNAEHMFEYK